MTAIIHEELFKFITDIEPKYNIENTIKYLKKEAIQRNISDETLELAWNEEFSALANGRKYSTEKCTCGCGQEAAGTDFIHKIRDRMISIDKKQTTLVKDFIQERYRLFLQNEMKRISKFDKDREKLIKGSMWDRLTNWETSWIYCKIKGQDRKKNIAAIKLAKVKKYSGK